MRIELNPRGLGYLVTGAPAVGDIHSGATWLFCCDPSSQDSEDTLQLLDLSEAQALGFESDQDYDHFLEERSVCFNRDWSQTSARIPHRLPERARLMFSVAEDLFDDLIDF